MHSSLVSRFNVPFRVGISLVAYNRLDEVQKTLTSLHAVLGPEDRVWVHDNASADQQALRALRQAFPWVCWTCSEQNIGFGAGHHANLEQMQGEGGQYAFLLNPDLALHPGDLEQLMEASRQVGDAWLLGPALVASEEPDPVLDSAGLEWDATFRSWDRWQGERWSETPLRDAMAAVLEVSGLCGAALWIPMALLPLRNEAWVFAPEYFAYGEDGELSLAWRRQGGQLGLVPGVRLVHRRGGFGKLSALQREDWEQRRRVVQSVLLNRYRTWYRYGREELQGWAWATWIAHELARWGYIALRKPFLLPLLPELLRVLREERNFLSSNRQDDA